MVHTVWYMQIWFIIGTIIYDLLYVVLPCSRTWFKGITSWALFWVWLAYSAKLVHQRFQCIYNCIYILCTVLWFYCWGIFFNWKPFWISDRSKSRPWRGAVDWVGVFRSGALMGLLFWNNVLLAVLLAHFSYILSRYNFLIWSIKNKFIWNWCWFSNLLHKLFI